MDTRGRGEQELKPVQVANKENWKKHRFSESKMIDQSFDHPLMSLKNTFEPYSKDSFLPQKDSLFKKQEKEVLLSDTFEIETLSQPNNAEVFSYSGMNDVNRTGLQDSSLHFEKKKPGQDSLGSHGRSQGRNTLSFNLNLETRWYEGEG